MSFILRRSLGLRPLAATAGAAAAARVPARAAFFSTTPARNVARITIVGHLGDTPELQTTANGRDLLKYVVASSSGPRDKRQTSWFRVSSFLPDGAQRDLLLSLPKGTLVFVEGEASLYGYQDNDGKNRTTLNVVQRSIEVLKRPNPTSTEGEA